MSAENSSYGSRVVVRPRKPTLVALHGYTLNGELTRQASRAALGPVLDQVDVLYLDAPHICSSESVRAAYAAWQTDPLPGPHHTWWYASDDGREYAGWDTTREYIRRALPAGGPIGLFGFSQGAMVAATLAALSAAGQFPELAFVVLVAGRTPRADALLPLFERTLEVPSLHVWGERDRLARVNAPELFDRFAAATRRQSVWRGSHVIPPGGSAAQDISDFILERLNKTVDS